MTHETVNSAPTRTYTVEQLGAMYQTPPSTFEDLFRRRVLPCLLVGRKYRALGRHLPEYDAYFERQAEPEQTQSSGTPRRHAVKADGSAVTTLRARRPKRRPA